MLGLRAGFVKPAAATRNRMGRPVGVPEEVLKIFAATYSCEMRISRQCRRLQLRNTLIQTDCTAG